MPRRGQNISHRTIGGSEHKWCSRCEQWKPLKSFYFSKVKGRHIHPCKMCRSRKDNPTNGWVSYQPTVDGWLRALVNRVGKAETARLCGWNKSRVTKYLGPNAPRQVQRSTAKLILNAYRDVVASGVILSRNSIKHGSFERGKPVHMAEREKELYNRHGDQAAENRRKSRRVHREAD